MQGSGYLHELGDKSAIVHCEPKQAPDLSNGGGDGPLLIASIFPSSVALTLTEIICPMYVICLQNNSHLEGLSFSLACSSFWNMASSLIRCVTGSLKRMAII